MSRILFVSDAASVHTRRWVECFRDRGHDVHIASFRPYDVRGVTLHVLPTYGLGRLGYLAAVSALKKLNRNLLPDIVHAQYVTSYGFLSALADIGPLIVTAWGTDVLIAPKKSKLMRMLASYAVQRADAVTTVAQHMNAAVAALGVPAEDIAAIPFGVDTQRFRPPNVLRPENGPLRVICTRNFGPIYSVNTLITALEGLAKRGVRLEVDLLGEGPLRGALEEQVERAGMRGWVTFHGHVDQERLVELLVRAHMFVTPALSDGNNVSLNEAMACGCFPIATDIPANAQWIEHGINGLLYPSGDATCLAECILRAASDAGWRVRASTINREIVEARADWNVCVERMEDTYVRAMHHAGRRT